MIFSTLCVSFLLATASGFPRTLPTFEWKQGDPSHMAILKITYPSGDSDVARLSPYNPIPSIQRSDLCIFNGYLQEEPDSYVTLSGCPGGENFEIMFRSQHLDDFMFRVSSGKVESVKPLLGTTSVNRDGTQVTYKDIVVESKTSMNPLSQNEVRQLNSKGYVMKVKVRYDDSFKTNFAGRIDQTIASVMAFAQAQYKLSSLTTTIDFDIAAPEYIPGKYKPANADDLNAVSKFSTDPNFNAYVYLVCSNASAGNVGIGFTGTVCDSDVTGRTSLNEWEKSDLNTGITIAHEIGHNLGMRHDFGPNGKEDMRYDSTGKPCTKVGGIMDYNEPFILWSTCSVEDFKGYVAKNQPFCLQSK